MTRATAIWIGLIVCLAGHPARSDETAAPDGATGPDAAEAHALAHERHHADAFDFPLFSIFHHRHHGEHAETRVVNVPLFSLYRSERYRDGEYDIRLVDLPLLGSLFRVRRTDQEDRTEALFLIRLRHSKR